MKVGSRDNLKFKERCAGMSFCSLEFSIAELEEADRSDEAMCEFVRSSGEVDMFIGERERKVVREIGN